MSDPRLYIATQDPRQGGGVATMTEFVYRCARAAGFDPCVVFNMLDRDSQIRLSSPWELVTTGKRNRVQRMNVRGMEAKGVPLVFPEIEPLQNVLNRRTWRHAVADGECFFAVGGTNHVGLPFAFEDRSFGSWTATPLWEDRRDRLADAPTIERVRDIVSKPALLALERFAFGRADPAFLLSEYTREAVSDTHGIPADRFEVVPFPIDTERFTPEGPVADAAGGPGPVVLFVGRLNDPRKNIVDLIEAFAEVRAELPDARLRLIGAEPADRLRKAVERNGLHDDVEFPGAIPNEELPAHYRGADLFVMPSAQEGLAIVGLEAMACGVPVVSTRCGGPEQYVVDGETGYLVDVGDRAALAERITSVLANETVGRELGERARDLMVTDYAEERIRMKFEDAFDALAASAE